MSNYPNSHLYSNNNIYKIVLSMEDNQDSQGFYYDIDMNK